MESECVGESYEYDLISSEDTAESSWVVMDQFTGNEVPMFKSWSELGGVRGAGELDSRIRNTVAGLGRGGLAVADERILRAISDERRVGLRGTIAIDPLGGLTRALRLLEVFGYAPEAAEKELG